MSQVDWENAPDWAESVSMPDWIDRPVWVGSGLYQYVFGCQSGNAFDVDPSRSYKVVEMRPDEWKKGAERMEQIAQNGNGGEVYAELENNKSKYHREIKKGVLVDVYDVLSAFEVVNPAMQHALKKMLAPGKRGAKDVVQDMQEAIQSIERAIELEKEQGE